MSTLAHPEIVGADLPAGVVVASPTGDRRRLAGDGAISDAPAELVARGHTPITVRFAVAPFGVNTT